MPEQTATRGAGPGGRAERIDRVNAAGRVGAIRRQASIVVRASGMRRPPFAPERYAARCGVAAIVTEPLEGEPVRVELRPSPGGGTARAFVAVDRALPPHTPQWNGAVALGLGEALVGGAAAPDEARRLLIEVAAAELLLPMAAFRPVALRTDLTVDGLRDLAARFAAPIRLTARQWLATGAWHGFALLWRDSGDGLRLGWRASSGPRFPPTLGIGAAAADAWDPASRLFATHRTGRPHHGVEQVRTGAGTAWWFTRFGAVRESAPGAGASASRAPFAMVLLAAGGRAEGIAAGSSK